MHSHHLFSKSIHTLLICFALISCKPVSERKAIALVSKSIEAHGGSEAWENVESLSFLKETRLYHADSSLENELFQEIEIRFRPHMEIQMGWEKDSIRHKALFDGKRTMYWLGENHIQNADFLKSKKRDLDAAAYVITKPFDLLKGEKHLEYIGLKWLPDGKIYESIQVIDGVSENGKLDVWVYYLDPESYRLVAYAVKTSDHTSLVMNEDFELFAGLLFPQSRTSYRLRHNGEVEYLRAEYRYKDYIIITRKKP